MTTSGAGIGSGIRPPPRRRRPPHHLPGRGLR